MSECYKIKDQDKLYFITFATVGWIDVFSRKDYVEILLESIRFCQQNKGLEVFSWCIMSNHVHMIIGRNGIINQEDIVRDLKKFTSKKIIQAIEEHKGESRKEWMLKLFKYYGQKTGKHKNYMFWQNEYHPIELSTFDIALQKLNYIHLNPVESGIVRCPGDYQYSSAMDYESNISGLLKIKFLY